jgi:MFS family permease
MESTSKATVVENKLGAQNQAAFKPKMPIWVPLRHVRYRMLWISNALSNTGTWMQAMAAAWLMTSLTSSPVMAASIQTATNLPIFLFAVIAGTLADIVDRPKFLLIVNTQMALSALALSILVMFGLITPWLLLTLTFMLGLGAAFMWPAWQASMSGLVDHSEISTAATLNGLSYNLASVIGPALGGLLFKSSGPAALFTLNAISFSGLIIVYYRWWKSPHEITTTNQRFWDAFITGFKVVLDAPSFHAILINTGIILFATSAFMSLLPLVVKDMLHLDSGIYGLLMGCLGIGAVAGAFILPTLRAKFSTQWLLSVATIVFSFLLFTLATVHYVKLLMCVICVSGIAWVTIVSSLNAAAQSSFPLKLRARVLSIYMIIMSGALAFGSYTWGLLATSYSIKTALLAAAVLLVMSPLLTIRWPVKIQ